jgi:hypothetical protein
MRGGPSLGSPHMDILVTGGAGFIGSHVCARLLQERHTVWAVDDLNDFDDPNLKRSALREFQASARPDGANPAPASNSDRSCCVVSCTSSRIDIPARQHSNVSPLTESLDEAAPDGAGHPSELPVRAQRFHRDRFRSGDKGEVARAPGTGLRNPPLASERLGALLERDLPG